MGQARQRAGPGAGAAGRPTHEGERASQGGCQASDADVDRCGAIKKDKDVEESNKQGGKAINFLLNKEYVNVWI